MLNRCPKCDGKGWLPHGYLDRKQCQTCGGARHISDAHLAMVQEMDRQQRILDLEQEQQDLDARLASYTNGCARLGLEEDMYARDSWTTDEFMRPDCRPSEQGFEVQRRYTKLMQDMVRAREMCLKRLAKIKAELVELRGHKCHA